MLQSKIDHLKKQNAVQIDVKSQGVAAVKFDEEVRSVGDEGPTLESSRGGHKEVGENVSRPPSEQRKREGDVGEEDIEDLLSQVPTEMIS